MYAFVFFSGISYMKYLGPFDIFVCFWIVLFVKCEQQGSLKVEGFFVFFFPTALKWPEKFVCDGI